MYIKCVYVYKCDYRCEFFQVFGGAYESLSVHIFICVLEGYEYGSMEYIHVTHVLSR